MTHILSRIPRPSWLRRLRAKAHFLWSGSRKRIDGGGHGIIYHDSLLTRCSIEISGSNNTLEIQSGSRLWNVNIRLSGKGLRCRIGNDCRLHGGHYILEDEGSALEIGKGATIFGPMFVVNEGGAIRIGNDCMIAIGTDLRNSDGHSILDASTRKRINPARDIIVEDHVWVGAHCQILKGVRIESRAIVAARSVLTKNVAAGTLVAGVPARVIRENVDWDGRRL